jgi:hypothetical protein
LRKRYRLAHAKLRGKNRTGKSGKPDRGKVGRRRHTRNLSGHLVRRIFVAADGKIGTPGGAAGRMTDPAI